MENLFANAEFLDFIVTTGLVYIVFLYFLSVLWVSKDSASRFENVTMQFISVFISIVPFFGLPLYLIIRPIRYKYDALTWRESLAVNTCECSDCGSINSSEFTHCVFCGDKLINACKECKKDYSISFDYCPDCGAPNLR